MAPTLLIGDHVLAWKGAFMTPITRGTIVVFPAPHEPSAKYIKRVVGLPGDEIAFDEDRPVITGLRTDHGESTPAEDIDDVCESRPVSWVEETIAERSWTIALSERPGILANAQKVVVPPGMLYVVGDNRDHSQDSRAWGFVEQAEVIGTVDRIWWSWDACAGGPRSNRTGPVR
jgi:signal peptidase I